MTLHLLAGVSGTAVLATVMALLGLAALALLGWAARRSVRGVMRPVERLHAELTAIDDREPKDRVTVPSTGDAVELLAGRVNLLLGRLQEAAGHRRSFISDASHELRTPLTGLRTRIELALSAPDETDVNDTLRHALDDVERLHQIVEDLLLLARLDSGERPERELLDIGALVEDEIGRRDPPVPTTVKAEPRLVARVNGVRLRRALANLLANAERHATTLIEVEVHAEGAEVVVEVRDDGPGIPPADRERIFDRFVRLDSARSRTDGGSGLGLAIAWQIAAAHDGRLYAEDHVKGARIVLRIPLVRVP
ncbi:MAG TPA: HAMP domain-containing sensor histidine kinase [Spirillospora sp.]